MNRRGRTEGDGFAEMLRRTAVSDQRPGVRTLVMTDGKFANSNADTHSKSVHELPRSPASLVSDTIAFPFPSHIAR